MEQSYLNWAFGIINLILGGLLKAMWDSYRDLRVADGHLAEKVKEIEILVAGEYVKRDELERLAAMLAQKLDKIVDKLDKKADR